ncbi:MAG: rhomboid family intramembrane serine protease [Dysgonamonadaceae bacterium]|nr:rhomboid family intramembrane serine protease [Dysgonamonadaceae bacterium]
MLTIIIIALTCVVSVWAFGNRDLMNRLVFFPPAVGAGQWYRLFSYGILHANYTHLFFNMFTFYLFGTYVEEACIFSLGSQTGAVCYLLLYLTALPISILPSYYGHRSDTSYYGVGASGAVSAVVFAYVLVNPMNFMGVMFIPIMMPAFLFAIIFVAVSVYLDKNYPCGINHLAHIAGGIYGLVYMVLAFFALIGFNLVARFFSLIKVDSIGDLIHFGF